MVMDLRVGARPSCSQFLFPDGLCKEAFEEHDCCMPRQIAAVLKIECADVCLDMDVVERRVYPDAPTSWHEVVHSQNGAGILPGTGSRLRHRAKHPRRRSIQIKHELSRFTSRIATSTPPPAPVVPSRTAGRSSTRSSDGSRRRAPRPSSRTGSPGNGSANPGISSSTPRSFRASAPGSWRRGGTRSVS